MELAAAPPPDLLSVAAPQSRGPPSAVRPPGARDPDGSPTVAPFDLLLQMLRAALPTGQTLPVGGSDLPGSAPSTSATTPTTTPSAPSAPVTTGTTGTTGMPGVPTQPAPTDLADLLRLALARAGAAATAAAPQASTDASTPTYAAPPGPTAANGAPPAPTQAQTASGAAPIDLQALLGDATAPASPAPQAAALDNAPRARTAADAARRTTQSVTPASAAAQVATSDVVSTDAVAQAAPDGEPLPVVAPVVSTVATKVTSLDDALPLDVTSTPSADASSAIAPPLAHAPTPAHTTAAAPAPSAAPQGSGDTLDTSSTRWHETLANRVQWLVDHDIGEAKIKLNPPELGALDVKISMFDDKTFVQMTAHNASARDELAQGLPRLRELLSAGGLELGGATVSGGHDDRGAFGSSAPHTVSRLAAFASTADEALGDTPRPRLGSSAAVIDTFA